MFTGLIQAVGEVVRVDGGWLEVAVLEAPEAWEPWQKGESVAVSGACLTVVAHDPLLGFDVSEETFARTTLGSLKSGSRVNLERALRAGDRLGGHLVQGHVDAVGKLVSVEEAENAWIYRFAAPTEFDRYLIDKGSVAIEGISLTVVRPSAGEFEVWVIPHTRQVTNLGSLSAGSPVNLEFDQVAKYLEKLAAPRLD
jgi:riboflavin synthase